MELIVDVHIHSHYSRATSKEMNIASLYRWGKQKGISVMGTGDFTHPGWFAELQRKLQPAESGLFTLKPEFAQEQDRQLPQQIAQQSMRYLLTVEISTIYSKRGKVRKLHHVIVVPNFAAAAKINKQLAQVGNLMADGRPILGLDSKELLKITLDADPDCLFIPAHIWTPWFSMFGSKSGFDSIEETFDELASHIHTVETGLSSDPIMNWRVSDLDQVNLVSNSDAHSPRKLGREANVLTCEMNYSQIIGALKTGDKRFVGTIEFYPEEGKYHYDGHRVCEVIFAPTESKRHNNICPQCGRPLTLGVAHRVEVLADRPEDYLPPAPKRKQVEYIVPLTEILMQILTIKTESSKLVQDTYLQLLNHFGNEFSILRMIETNQFRSAGFDDLAQAITNMRSGKVKKNPGFDGVFGTIEVCQPTQADKNKHAQLGFGF